MYVDENHWARSSPLPHECAPDTDQEILMKSYFARFGPDAPEVDNGGMVSVFGLSRRLQLDRAFKRWSCQGILPATGLCDQAEVDIRARGLGP